MGLFDQSGKWGPSLTEPPHFQRLREIADRAADRVTGDARDEQQRGRETETMSAESLARADERAARQAGRDEAARTRENAAETARSRRAGETAEVRDPRRMPARVRPQRQGRSR